jgi:hypothetical protein
MPSPVAIRRCAILSLWEGVCGESGLFRAHEQRNRIEQALLEEEALREHAVARVLLREYEKDWRAKPFPRRRIFSRSAKLYAHSKCEAEDLELYAKKKGKDADSCASEVKWLEGLEREKAQRKQVRSDFRKHGDNRPRPHLDELAAFDDHLDAPILALMVTCGDRVIEYVTFSINEYKALSEDCPSACVLYTMDQFLQEEGHPDFDARRGWGDLPFLNSPKHSVPGVMAHFRAQAQAKPGWGRYMMGAMEWASLAELVDEHKPPIETSTLTGDPEVYKEHFWDSLELARVKPDGPFGMLRLAHDLVENKGCSTSIQDCLRAYAKEHAEDLRALCATPTKPQAEPLFVITAAIRECEAIFYPLTLSSNAPPIPRPWSP